MKTRLISSSSGGNHFNVCKRKIKRKGRKKKTRNGFLRKLVQRRPDGSTTSENYVSKLQSFNGVIHFNASVEVYFCCRCENPFPSRDMQRQHKMLLNKRKPVPLQHSNEANSVPASKDSWDSWVICVKKVPSICPAPKWHQNDYNKCGYCHKYFQNIRRFRQHSMFCTEMKKLFTERECTFCKKSFSNRKMRDRHIFYCSKLTHGTSLVVNEDFTCELCDQVFSYLRDYNLHMCITHDQRYCSKCDTMYRPDVTDGCNHDCIAFLKRTTVAARMGTSVSSATGDDNKNESIDHNARKILSTERRSDRILKRQNVKGDLLTDSYKLQKFTISVENIRKRLIYDIKQDVRVRNVTPRECKVDSTFEIYTIDDTSEEEEEEEEEESERGEQMEKTTKENYSCVPPMR